jgi:lipoprotein-anchoring transpeptidase ErfK/SrfK
MRRRKRHHAAKPGAGAIMKRLSGGRLARLAFAAAAIMPALALTPAHADVVVHIDKSSQRMAVSVDGMTRYHWPVSTGRSGYGTPSGVFHPQMMARRWFSRKYYNSPMPHSIFFYGGFAIHGTNDISRLGGPASHGCIRLHPSHAAALFALVARNGPRATRIEISN